MTFDFNNIADDFFVNMNLQTTLELPRSRESVLHFCDAVRKEFPAMANFYRRDNGDFALEGDRESSAYRWLELQQRGMTGGYFNPPDPAEAFNQHRWLLDRSTYFLDVSGLDVECVDILFGFNMNFCGNRDAIVFEALLAEAPLAALATEGGAKVIECEPNMVLTLDEECSLQARLSIETRCSSYQVRTGRYENEPVSVYFTVRRYPHPGEVIDFAESFDAQCTTCEELAWRMLVPNVVAPITAAIARAQ